MNTWKLPFSFPRRSDCRPRLSGTFARVEARKIPSIRICERGLDKGRISRFLLNRPSVSAWFFLHSGLLSALSFSYWVVCWLASLSPESSWLADISQGCVTTVTFKTISTRWIKLKKVVVCLLACLTLCFLRCYPCRTWSHDGSALLKAIYIPYFSPYQPRILIHLSPR